MICSCSAFYFLRLAFLSRAARSDAASFANARNYGARGDGFTNDFAAIQHALDAAHAAGGGTVMVQVGQYRVMLAPSDNASLRHALVMYPGVMLTGAGANQTTIRLADDQGSYGSLLASAMIGTDISNLTPQNLLFDHNTTHNLLNSLDDVALRRRRAEPRSASARCRTASTF